MYTMTLVGEVRNEVGSGVGDGQGGGSLDGLGGGRRGSGLNGTNGMSVEHGTPNWCPQGRHCHFLCKTG